MLAAIATTILTMLQSKKAVATGVALVVQGVGVLASHLGHPVDQAELTVAISPIYAYVLGQAIADIGKPAAQVKATTTDTSTVVVTTKAAA